MMQIRERPGRPARSRNQFLFGARSLSGGGSFSARVSLTNLLTAGGATVANYQLNVGLTDAGAGKCSAWANQIGTAPGLSAAGTARPDIQADGSLLFDGIANVMTSDITLSQPVTYYVVASVVVYSAQGRIITSAGDASTIYLYSDIPQQVRLYAGTADIESGAVSTGVFSLITAIGNGGSSSIQVSPAAAVTGNAGIGGIATPFAVGGRGDNFFFSNIQVKEIIIRSVADSAGTQAQIQVLLKALHGTP